MLKNYIKWLLFLSSYIPLYLILLLFAWDSNRLIFYFLIGLTASTIIALLIVLTALNSFEKTFVKLKKVGPKNSEFISYIFTYILPFLSSNFSDVKYIIAMAGIFLLI